MKFFLQFYFTFLHFHFFTMKQINLSKDCENIINSLQDTKPSLLLHVCCAPCSTYVLEYLSQYFDITLYFYNPNIHPKDEYEIRLSQMKVLLKKANLEKISLIEDSYETEKFFALTEKYKLSGENGKRCYYCFYLRMKKACEYAKNHNFSYFTTTLSISPHKDAKILYKIGQYLEKVYSVKQLPSDFKKKGGFLRSIELSKQYELYRQDYCGCVYSLHERKNESINHTGAHCLLCENLKERS